MLKFSFCKLLFLLKETVLVSDRVEGLKKCLLKKLEAAFIFTPAFEVLFKLTDPLWL